MAKGSKLFTLSIGFYSNTPLAVYKTGTGDRRMIEMIVRETLKTLAEQKLPEVATEVIAQIQAAIDEYQGKQIDFNVCPVIELPVQVN